MSGPPNEERWVPPIPVAPKMGESVRGLLLRYCDENGWPTLHHFCKLIGVTPEGIRIGEGLDILAAALGLSVDELERLVIRRVSTGALEYRGNRLPSSAYRSKSRHVCPGCLSSSEHAMWWWEFEISAVCPRHSLRLENTCGCGRPLTWNDANLGQCRECSIEGRELGITGEAADIGGYELWSLARLGEVQIGLPGVRLLDQLDFRTANHLVESIGILVEFGFSEGKPVTAGAFEDGRILRELGFKTLVEPGALYNLARHHHSAFIRETGRLFPGRPIDIFGWFAAEFQFLMPLYSDFAVAVAAALEEALQFPVTDACRMDYVPFAPLTKRLGIPEAVARDFLKLSDRSHLIISHPAGTLLQRDVEPDVVAMAADMRSA